MVMYFLFLFINQERNFTKYTNCGEWKWSQVFLGDRKQPSIKEKNRPAVSCLISKQIVQLSVIIAVTVKNRASFYLLECVLHMPVSEFIPPFHHLSLFYLILHTIWWAGWWWRVLWTDVRLHPCQIHLLMWKVHFQKKLTEKQHKWGSIRTTSV